MLRAPAPDAPPAPSRPRRPRGACRCCARPRAAAAAATAPRPPSQPPAPAGSVTVVGLGPGGPELLTVQAREALLASPRVHSRTAAHPTLAALPLRSPPTTFDALYDAAAVPGDVYAAVAARLAQLAASGEAVVYAVPGDPCVAEASVRLLRALCASQRIRFSILPGLSFVEPCLAAVGADALGTPGGLALVDAYDLAAAGYPTFGPHQPALVAQLASGHLASGVKLSLLAAYPPGHAVALLRASSPPAPSGGGGVAAEWVPLHALDRGAPPDARTSLYVPPIELLAAACDGTDDAAAAPGGGGGGRGSLEGVLGALARQRDALRGPWADADPGLGDASALLTRAAAAVAGAAAAAEGGGGGEPLLRALGDAAAALALACLAAEGEGLFGAPQVMAAAAAAVEGAGGGGGGGGGEPAAPRAGLGYTMEEGGDDEEEEGGGGGGE